jgi:hypothetical protein
MRAGFYKDGSMAKPATNTITIELEKHRLMRMCMIVERSTKRDDHEE